MTTVQTDFLTQLLASQINIVEHLFFAGIAGAVLGATLVFALSKIK